MDTPKDLSVSIYLAVLSTAGGLCMLSLMIFCLCGYLCCCRKCRSRQFHDATATSTLNKTIQLPSQQIKRPKPPRPPSPIYEYVPSTRPSGKVKEPNIEMKASESEEQHLDTPEALEMKSNENNEQGLEMKENLAYRPTQ